MNVGRLIQYLSTYPADLPVVFQTQDEPMGDYEVATVDLARMQRDPMWEGCDTRVYHPASAYSSTRYGPPQEVVLLGYEERVEVVVDAQAVAAAIERGSNP